MAPALARLIRSGISAGGDSDALWFGGRWRSWSWILRSAEALESVLAPGQAIGLLARNRPQHVAAFVAAIVQGRTTVMMTAAQSPSALAREIYDLKLPAIVADRSDWSEEALMAAAAAKSAAVAIQDGEQVMSASLVLPGDSQAHAFDSARGVELLTSGTTGPPKRIPLGWETCLQIVKGAHAAYVGTGARDAPQVMVHPLGSASGLAYVLPPFAQSQRLVLLEKFAVEPWAHAVRDHKPVRGTIPPAGVRLLLESDVPREWLSSLAVVAVGGGKLETALHDAFESRFGIPILTAYGATEFGGVAANWTLASYRRWGSRKRGSAGRTCPGVAFRTIDAVTLAPLAHGKIGILEARVDRIGPQWIRTNDLASVDEDDFLFLHGRVDRAINRGGFKIVPDPIADVMREHAAVADAAIVAKPDVRVGEVPVAAVELKKGARVSVAELSAHLAARLPAYQLPVALRIVAALPRNSSFKISHDEVLALFERPGEPRLGRGSMRRTGLGRKRGGVGKTAAASLFSACSKNY